MKAEATIRNHPGAAPAPDEQLLIDASRLGDRAAFEELYRRYRRPIGDLCRAMTRDPARVEDLTQETFLRAFQNMPRFTPGKLLWPWLSTIARRLCVDEFRSRGKAPRATDEISKIDIDAGEAADFTSEDVIERTERIRLRDILSTALTALRPADRRVLFLRSVEEWSYEDIAQLDGRTVDAVRNVAWRARVTVRAMLGPEAISRNFAFIPALLTAARALRERTRTRVARLMMDVMPQRLMVATGEQAAAIWLTAASVVLALTGFAVLGSGQSYRGTTIAAMTNTHQPLRDRSPGASGARLMASEATDFDAGVGGPDFPLTYSYEAEPPRSGTLGVSPHDEETVRIEINPADYSLPGPSVGIDSPMGGDCDNVLGSVSPIPAC